MSLALFHPAAVDKNKCITDEPINAAALLAEAHHPKAGAIVLFSGEVRDNNAGEEVDYLFYESHIALAQNTINAILKEATERWSLNLAVAQHRIGKVEIGESAVVVITASPHRKEAYIANRFIIDKIKHEAPIWKCEYFKNGQKVWGNNCNCSSVTGSADKHVYEYTND